MMDLQTMTHECDCYICRASRAIDLLEAHADSTEAERAAVTELKHYIEETIERGASRDDDIFYLAGLVGLPLTTPSIVSETARRIEEMKQIVSTEALRRGAQR